MTRVLVWTKVRTVSSPMSPFHPDWVEDWLRYSNGMVLGTLVRFVRDYPGSLLLVELKGIPVREFRVLSF